MTTSDAIPDTRCTARHTPPPHQDDAFYVTGTAVEVFDRALWQQLADQMLAERSLTNPWPGFAAVS